MIKQAVLEMGGLLFGIALQAKQPRGIAFVDRYLEVAGRIEQGELFSLGHIGIGFAYFVNHFIAFKGNSKAPAFSLRFKGFAGNIDHYILEMIDKDDLSLHPVFTQQRAQRVLFQDVNIGRTDGMDALAIGDRLYGFSEGTGNVQGILYCCFVHRQPDHHFRFLLEDHGEQSVVGA